MDVSLVEIPLLPDTPSARWKVRALVINDVSPAISALHAWEKKENADFKKIVKALRFAASETRCPDEKHVKKCANSKYGDIYEARAHKGHARLMFFYYDDSIIVCTNEFWKERGDQDKAFERCGKLRNIFTEFYEEED